MMAHPLTGDLYIITRWSARRGRLPLPQPLQPDTESVLEKVADLDLPPARCSSPAATSIRAGRMLLRSYGALARCSCRPASPSSHLHRPRPASQVPVAREPQGEAVAYAADGLGYFTMSEGGNPP